MTHLPELIEKLEAEIAKKTKRQLKKEQLESQKYFEGLKKRLMELAKKSA
jgi:hypothetical protein